MKKYLLKNRTLILLFIILVPLSCYFSIRFGLSFEPIINSAINKDLNMLKISAIWCGIYATLDCVFLLIVKYIRENILKEAYIGVKNDLFSNIIKMDVDTFNSENSGSYILL